MDQKSQRKYWQWFPLHTQDESAGSPAPQAPHGDENPAQAATAQQQADIDVQVEITACCLRTLA